MRQHRNPIHITHTRHSMAAVSKKSKVNSAGQRLCIIIIIIIIIINF
jgi:hypothetical protein